jgi:hypothetical protein
MGKHKRIVISVVAVLALVVAALATIAVTRSSQGPSRETEREQEGRENPLAAMREALERNPALAEHRLALAFVSEKLEEHGGEAGGEVLTGPSQEAYDQRAYPRRYIAPLQQSRAGAAFGRARLRATTRTGRATLAAAADRATAPSWRPLGPDGGRVAAEATYTGSEEFVSGRVTALAISRGCTTRSCTLWAGTAGGGLWRSTNPLSASPTWRSIGAGIPSTAIGSLYLAPNGDLYAGTGEPNGSSDSEAGVGLYRSTDGGSSFTHLAGADRFTVDRSIGAIAVDPRNPRHLLIGTAVARHGSSAVNGGRFTPPGAPQVGVYESLDAGRSWTLSLSQESDVVDPTDPTGADFFRGGISKILFDPTHRNVVYASMFDYGLFRATTAMARTSWHSIYEIKTPGAVASSRFSRVEFSLATQTVARFKGRTRVYLGDATYYGDTVKGFAAGFLRSDDGTAGTPTWHTLSNPQPGTRGFGSYNFCHGQCSYDMVVEGPRRNPNEVLLAGAMNYPELLAFAGPGSSNGRAVVRSTDKGARFFDMTNDARAHPHGLHPDHHALVFVPGTAGTPREQFFTGSDGGVVRTAAPFRDRSSECGLRGVFGPARDNCEQWLSAIPSANVTLNKGLQTLQFQSVSVPPTSGVVQGGTQDNGTWESDIGGFSEVIGGDGGQSGFDPTNTDVRFHSYFGPSHDVSFDGGSPRSWDFIGEPLADSKEAASFYVPLTPDPSVSGTVFDGLQHVWRTTDNGGDRATLDRYCNQINGDFGAKGRPPCGDWQALGGPAGDLSGGDATNYVVAVERAPTAGSHTMWAATRKGDLYVTTNAHATDPAAVKYKRYDEVLGLPNRFVSSIAVDPADPNHAYLSYSGYSAYSPGGHVYEVTIDPVTGTGTARDLSGGPTDGLGDQPVTDLVYSPSTGSLYASTDFGVLTRTLGSTRWVATRGLPRVAVYGLTLDERARTLYAATHGRSVWSLRFG